MKKITLITYSNFETLTIKTKSKSDSQNDNTNKISKLTFQTHW